jgi:ATP-binding cassette, subfamily C (CFTR/MRP), member 1
MMAAAVTQTVVLHQYFFRVFRVGMNLRSTVIVAVYQKAIRLSIGARQSKSVGEIVNIMSTDSQRLQDLTTYLQMIWSAPLQIALSIYFLWQQIGVSVMAGVAVMIFFIPFQGILARRLKTFQTKLMKVKDQRVNLTNEALNGIKLIKYSGWENNFVTRIRTIRNAELKQLLHYMVRQGCYLFPTCAAGEGPVRHVFPAVQCGVVSVLVLCAASRVAVILCYVFPHGQPTHCCEVSFSSSVP